MAVDLEQDVARREQLQAIKDARDLARRAERRADEDGEEPVEATPHWRTVRDRAKKALESGLKDLDIASYLIEAAARLEGFGGVRDGYHIVRELIETSWDELHPMPDEEGLTVRVLPLARLNGIETEGLLIGPLTRVPVTQGRTVGPYSPWHQQQVNDFSSLSERERRSRDETGGVTPERFLQAVRETDTSFFQQTVDELTGCIEEFDAVTKLLDEKCGQDDHGHSLAPPSTSIKNTLEQILSGIRSVARDRLPAAGGSATPDAAAGANGAATTGVPAIGGAAADHGPSRDDAFRWLAAAAEYFERHEPQSLIPAQIRKIIRWGRLPPEKYYQELLDDSSVTERLFKLVGIELPQEENNS